MVAAGLGGSLLTAIGSLGVAAYHQRATSKDQARHDLRSACEELAVSSLGFAKRADAARSTACDHTRWWGLGRVVWPPRMDELAAHDWLRQDYDRVVQAYSHIQVDGTVDLRERATELVAACETVISLASAAPAQRGRSGARLVTLLPERWLRRLPLAHTWSKDQMREWQDAADLLMSNREAFVESVSSEFGPAKGRVKPKDDSEGIGQGEQNRLPRQGSTPSDSEARQAADPLAYGDNTNDRQALPERRLNGAGADSDGRQNRQNGSSPARLAARGQP